VFVEIDAHELGRDHLGFLGHEVVRQAVRERRLLQCEQFHAQGVEPGKQPVRAGLQHTLEIAIAQQQAALVLLHGDTLDLHGSSPSWLKRVAEKGAVTAAAADDECLGPEPRCALVASFLQATSAGRGCEAPRARRTGGRR
jgi:hypothetical protein